MLTPALDRLYERLTARQTTRRLSPRSKYLLDELEMLKANPAFEQIRRTSATPPMPIGSVDECECCGCDVTSCH